MEITDMLINYRNALKRINEDIPSMTVDELRECCSELIIQQTEMTGLLAFNIKCEKTRCGHGTKQTDIVEQFMVLEEEIQKKKLDKQLENSKN